MSTKQKYSIIEDKLGIDFQDYMLLKKYILGSEAIKASFNMLTNNINIHRQLIRKELQQIYEKEVIGMVFKAKLPFKDVDISEINPTKSGTNFKETKSVLNNIDKCIGKGIVINFYSETGDQALKASVYCYEQLSKQYKGMVTNGVEINSSAVDFDNNDVASLVLRDFLCINAINSIYITEFRKNYLNNIFMSAKLKSIPVITSSNEPITVENMKVLNLRLTDTKKTQSQIIEELFTEGK